MKCPFCEYDSFLDEKIFSSEDKDWLPKTRWLQACVKYLKIKKLSELKEYKNMHPLCSERVRDLLKDCLNDMEMALEVKYGKEFKPKLTVIPPKSPCYSCQYGNIQFWHESQFLRGKKVKSKCWETWMDQLAKIRNNAIHKSTIFSIKKTFGPDGVQTRYYLRAISLNGEQTQTDEEVLPYLEETLKRIRERLEITENIERICDPF